MSLKRRIALRIAAFVVVSLLIFLGAIGASSILSQSSSSGFFGGQQNVLELHHADGKGPRYVMIRFDDSLQDQWVYALPVLQKYNFTATFLVITDALENGTIKGLAYPYQSMSWQEVESLYNKSYVIVDHSSTHPDMDYLDCWGLNYQVAYSRYQLLEHGIENVSDFALPYGSGFDNATLLSYILGSGFSHVYSAWGIPGMTNYTDLTTEWYGIDHNFGHSNFTYFQSVVNQSDSSFVVGLEYHHIDNNISSTEYYVNTTEFDQEMAWLNESGFTIITPYQLPDYFGNSNETTTTTTSTATCTESIPTSTTSTTSPSTTSSNQSSSFSYQAQSTGTEPQPIMSSSSLKSESTIMGEAGGVQTQSSTISSSSSSPHVTSPNQSSSNLMAETATFIVICTTAFSAALLFLRAKQSGNKP